MDSRVKSAEALEWIIDFLEASDIPYLVCGGLAAIAYGSQRPLHDIDLYVPSQNYRSVSDYGREYATYGPKRLTDSHWDVEYVQFNYFGQKIEVGSSENIRIFDSLNQKWHQKQLDFSAYSNIVVLGKKVRVMDKRSLIGYKKHLNRAVDISDIEEIKDA